MGATPFSSTDDGADVGMTSKLRTDDGSDRYDGLLEPSSLETPSPLGGWAEAQGVGRCLERLCKNASHASYPSLERVSTVIPPVISVIGAGFLVMSNGSSASL